MPSLIGWHAVSLISKSMTQISMLFDMTLLLFLLAASLITIKARKKYKHAATLINERNSARLAFRFSIYLVLLLFCAVNVSEEAFFVPILSCAFGTALLFEPVADKVFLTIREYRRAILVLYLATFLLMFVSQGEGICLLLLCCLLETASQYYLDWDTYYNRFNHK